MRSVGKWRPDGVGWPLWEQFFSDVRKHAPVQFRGRALMLFGHAPHFNAALWASLAIRSIKRA